MKKFLLIFFSLFLVATATSAELELTETYVDDTGANIYNETASNAWTDGDLALSNNGVNIETDLFSIGQHDELRVNLTTYLPADEPWVDGYIRDGNGNALRDIWVEKTTRDGEVEYKSRIWTFSDYQFDELLIRYPDSPYGTGFAYLEIEGYDEPETVDIQNLSLEHGRKKIKAVAEMNVKSGNINNATFTVSQDSVNETIKTSEISSRNGKVVFDLINEERGSFSATMNSMWINGTEYIPTGQTESETLDIERILTIDNLETSKYDSGNVEVILETDHSLDTVNLTANPVGDGEEVSKTYNLGTQPYSITTDFDKTTVEEYELVMESATLSDGTTETLDRNLGTFGKNYMESYVVGGGTTYSISDSFRMDPDYYYDNGNVTYYYRKDYTLRNGDVIEESNWERIDFGSSTETKNMSREIHTTVNTQFDEPGEYSVRTEIARANTSYVWDPDDDNVVTGNQYWKEFDVKKVGNISDEFEVLAANQTPSASQKLGDLFDSLLSGIIDSITQIFENQPTDVPQPNNPPVPSQ